MSWKSEGPLRTEGEDGYGPVMSESHFKDGFDEDFIVEAYREYLDGYKDAFEGTIQELDDGDTWNIRYYQGCVEAIDGVVSGGGYGSFSRLAEICEYRLEEIDHHSEAVNKQNDYWRRYFDGQVQTFTEIKKQCEKWSEVMGWAEAFDND